MSLCGPLTPARFFTASIVLITGLFLSTKTLSAQTHDPADQTCARYAEGSVIHEPPELRSQHGKLELTLHFRSIVDARGVTRYCYINGSGYEAPSLHVKPRDRLVIHLVNDLPAESAAGGVLQRASGCNATTMNNKSTNLHFHGMNVAPTCHSDEVIKTLIQAGQSFDYDLHIPANEPPGLYWYHPHLHGFSEAQVQGGASGAMVVDGIEAVHRELSKLPERTLILRDQIVPGERPKGKDADKSAPAWDISLNYVPITYPNYVPATIVTKPERKEFWRVLNAAADTIFNLELLVNGIPQQFEVAAIDGVPVKAPMSDTSLFLGPGGRVEVVVTTPGVNDHATLVTQRWDTGLDGDSDPARPIARVVARNNASEAPHLTTSVKAGAKDKPKSKEDLRFADVEEKKAVLERRLYFSERGDDDRPGGAAFFITVAGLTPAVFSMDQPPNIIVHQGSVEDWVIQNHSFEDHVFHIHQIHFQVLEVDGKPISDPAIRDTINIPHWVGGVAYPSVRLRMDFRDTNILGTFVYHCHILKHEDQGMMGSIQVVPPGFPTTITSLRSSPETVSRGEAIKLTATVSSADGGGPIGGSMQFLQDDGRIYQVSVQNGVANLKAVMSRVGSHTYTATYLGDVSYSPSPPQSISITVVVRP